MAREDRVAPEAPASSTAPPVAVQKCYDLVLYLLQRIEKLLAADRAARRR